MKATTEKKIVNLVHGLLSLLKVVLGGFKRGSDLRKSHKSKALILGNGPSLTAFIAENEELIQQSDLIAVNHLARSELFEILKPATLVLTPIEFWDHAHDAFLTAEFHKTADAILSKTNWPLTIVAPSIAKHCAHAFKYFEKNSHISIAFVEMTPIDGHQGIANWIMKRNMGLPRPHNVLIPSIVIAINMGYKNVLLAGADHSWMPYVRVTERNQVVMVQKHFYDSKDAEEKAMYNASSKGFDRKLHEVLQKFTYAFKSYFVINAYAKSRGCEILNLTKGSYIDAFNRQSAAEVG